MNPDNWIETIFRAVTQSPHPRAPDPDQFQATSVMALVALDPVPSLIFIQKADREGYPWRNQMAFPGGHMDKKDRSTRQTALRELREEMGIQAGNVRVAGSIGHFQTINQKDIEVFVGIWNQKETIVYDTAEIARVFFIPLDFLIQAHTESGYHGKMPHVLELTYVYEDVTIWGVTAKILHHLLEILIPSRSGRVGAGP